VPSGDKDKVDRAQIEYALTRLNAWPEDHAARLLSIKAVLEAKPDDLPAP
jgi:hypothetical protein